METRKLYDSDAYLTHFSATVLSCEPSGENLFDVVLDRTAFFPEEGGQSADRGTLGNARVENVKIKNGVVTHRTDAPLAVGETVEGEILFDERYEKMQCHTAEHIVSGLIHALFGGENVGFHLGADEVTLDVNLPLTRADLDRVETLACEAVFKNLPVDVRYPAPEELETLVYRSKLDLKENVRIVTVPGYDVCACCAPHVRLTGEIGLIKLLDFEKHKGGVRIWLTAGRRALRDFRMRYENVRAIGAMLSVKQSETADAVGKLKNALTLTESQWKAYRMNVWKKAGASLPDRKGNSVSLLDADLSYDELRAFAAEAANRCSGMAVALSEADGKRRYVIISAAIPVGTMIRDIHKDLPGHGGGKGNMVQGTFDADLEDIQAFFADERP